MNYDFLLVLLILSSILFGCYRGSLKQLQIFISMFVPSIIIILFGKKIVSLINNISFYENIIYYLEISIGKWFSLSNEFISSFIIYLIIFVILYLLIYYIYKLIMKSTKKVNDTTKQKMIKSKWIGALIGFFTSYFVIGVVLVVMNIFIPIKENTIIVNGYFVINTFVEKLIFSAFLGV